MPKKKSRSINKNDLSRKRRKKRSLKTYVYSSLIILFLVGFVFFIRMDAFQIKEINVVGASSSNTVLIKKSANKLMQGNIGFIIPRSSVFFYPQSEIRADIKSHFPSLSSVKVSTGLAGSLEIEVIERKPASLWCIGSSNCYFMDEIGFVFSPAVVDTSATNTIFIKYSGLINGDPINKKFADKSLGDDFFSKINTFISGLKSGELETESVAILSDDDAELIVSAGYGIKFNPQEVVVTKTRNDLIKNLTLFLNNLKSGNAGVLPDFSYIDARYGNKIFYRLK